MIERAEYLEKLYSFKDKNLIKVITGIRRCGKSTLFEQFIKKLNEEGVDESQIIFLNLEDYDFEFIKNAKDLYDYIKNKLHATKMNYIFIDEVQNIFEFEKVIDSLFIKKNCDIYITGSNSKLLSSEIATLLSGRYIEFKMFPLSFKEYCSNYKTIDKNKNYLNYINNSSFPLTTILNNQNDIKIYLNSLIDTIFIKDIIERGKFPDIEMLKSVLKFSFDNIGNTTSSNKIANTLNSSGRKVSVNTVESYITALNECYIFYEAKRYDLKGKQYLKTGNKYYAVDIGLRYALLGSEKGDNGRILENIIFLELLRRGYEVYIGKINDLEVDFVVKTNLGTEYYQVAYSAVDELTLERELKSLSKIKDNNPKYLITMDNLPIISHDGIKQINALDWLLNEY